MDPNVIRPLVTVLMPVYNGEKYLREAIESILNQSYTNFEFLIINDGSTDLTEEIIASYTDSRIRYVNNGQNIQLIATLNKGISLAKGKYIARMDADDIALPHRLERQVAFMEENSYVGICGSWVETFGVENKIIRYPEFHDEITVSLLFYSSISHPASIWRTEIFKKFSITFKEEYLQAEDYKLWTDLFLLTTFYNIQEVLLQYRIHLSQLGFVAPMNNIISTKKIKRELISKIFTEFTEHELFIIDDLLSGKSIFNRECISIINTICNANKINNYFNQNLLERKFANIWKNCFLESKTISCKELYFYITNSISKKANFTINQKLSIFKKFILN